MEKQKIICFYLVTSKYVCIFAAEIITKRISNNNKIQDYEKANKHLSTERVG